VHIPRSPGESATRAARGREETSLHPDLRSLIIADADAALASSKALRPPSSHIDVCLGELPVCHEQPEAKDGLGEDIEDGVCDNLGINTRATGTIGNTPDDGINGPENQGESSQGSKELLDAVALGHGRPTSMQGNVPDDKDVGNARNSIPSPLLHGVLFAKGCEQATEDHDEISHNGHQGVCAINTREEAEIQQQERRGDAPVDVSRPEDLAAHLVVRVGNVLVMVAHRRAVVGAGLARRHSEVGDSSREGDDGGDDMVETLGHGNIPGQEGEEARGEDHDDEDDPEGSEAVVASTLVVGRGGNDGRDRLHAMPSVGNGRCEILKHFDVLFSVMFQAVNRNGKDN